VQLNTTSRKMLVSKTSSKLVVEPQKHNCNLPQ